MQLLQATGFSTLFPGIRPHLLTLTSNFVIPFWRELLMSIGVCSVSRRSCVNILRKGGHVMLERLGRADV